MPPKNPAYINHLQLVWARTTLDLSIEDAARGIRVKPQRLSEWEQGETLPSMSQLRRIADFYGRPFPFFYLTEAPLEEQPVRDFRRLPSTKREKFGRDLLLSFRRAAERRAAALELMREIGSTPRPFSYRISPVDSIEAAASYIRSVLGVSFETRQTRRSESEVLKDWIAAVEALDVLILHVSRIPLTEMRAFCISHSDLPVICLNGSDHPNGRVFSLIHEVVHLMLNLSVISDQRGRGNAHGEIDNLERFCNAVAAEFLVPKEYFQSDVEVVAPAPGEEWSVTKLGVIARSYGVSREVIARRLLELRMISRQSFAQLQEELEREYRRAKEKRSEIEGGPTYYRVQARNLGRLFTGLVLDAYYRDAITLYEASNHLGVRVEKIGAIESEVFGKPLGFAG